MSGMAFDYIVKHMSLFPAGKLQHWDFTRIFIEAFPKRNRIYSATVAILHKNVKPPAIC